MSQIVNIEQLVWPSVHPLLRARLHASIQISQGSVTTDLRRGGKFYTIFLHLPIFHLR